MSLGPPNGTYNIGTELRALKEYESEDVKTAIDNIIDAIKSQTNIASQFPIDHQIYDQLHENYSVLLTAKNPALQTIARKYLGLNEQKKSTQSPNSTTGGRRRRHKHKTMKRRRSATKRRHQRKTGRRNRH